ncbi:MAG TPA: sugar transferase, partial [Petrotogaceae bacterium]|nr:sugar transferase [Petrotogaceae bacterium]
GMNGKSFYAYKLRTMNRVQENGEYVDKPTKIGNILRKFRINELPQIINVFNGDMSLVGPRPDVERTMFFCEEEIQFYHFRRTVPQGITGNAQVLYKYVDKLEKETFSKRLSYDIYFVKNYSFSLYFTTLLRTVETVAFGRGK